MFPFPGLDVALYGLSIPEVHSHGNTDRILTGYPSFYDYPDLKNPEIYQSEMRCNKNIRVIDGAGTYTNYFFRGDSITRNEFRRILKDPAFIFYNDTVTKVWNQNFANCIGRAGELDPMRIYPQTRYWLLKSLGAIPELPQENSNQAT